MDSRESLAMNRPRPAAPLRPLAVALLAVLPTAAAQPRLAPPAAAAAPAPPPRLIVFITVDQMRADYLDRFAPQYTGGATPPRRRAPPLANALHAPSTPR